MTDSAPARPAAPPPPVEPLSLVQRLDAIEGQLQRIFTMMARDREWLDDLREKIGL